MTDDYLLQEFHEAGIWLPEEMEAFRQARELRQRQDRMFLDMMKAQQARIGAAPVNPYPQSFLGQPIPVRHRGILGFLGGGIFGAL